ncbi:MAG TPA: ATP synthase F1 subunit delta [Acidimicrobiia bacterium]|nr:ATP synthase F1 subunit delta [Acidimicrobiia bacterium]
MRDSVGRTEGWARAIFDLASAEGELERAERDLFTIARAVNESNDLRDALTNPQLPVDRKQGIIDDLVGGRASDLIRGWISFLISQGRASDLPAIVDAFIEQAAASRSRAVAEIRSAIPLDKATVDRLVAALSRATGKQLDVKTVVDPDLIGGVVAQVGDVVIDGSVARRLTDLRQALRAG